MADRVQGKHPVKALGLLSGGLDSGLAARLLLDQGIEVEGVAFRSHFFGVSRGEAMARRLGIPFRAVDISGEHLAMVKAPPHGYGRNMNPCIDCHAMMFARAGALMEETGARFLFSGEVLGQRPMSQNPRSLDLVARLSGYAEVVLRPLSALLLPETGPEREGWVDRSRLLDISGRSRKRQIDLAARWGIEEYPNPAGGCLLTDPRFSHRLKELLVRDPGAGARGVESLRTGRHFRLPGGKKAVVGRQEAENPVVEALADPGDLLMTASGIPGAAVLLQGGAWEDPDLRPAASLALRYSKAAGQAAGVVLVRDGSGREETLEVSPALEEELEKWRI